jgi:integrase
MAYLKKRGKTYYAKWHKSIEGERISVRKSLRTRHKDVAQKMIRELEKLELLGEINPFEPGFDPIFALKKPEDPRKIVCRTVREAADKFVESKKHLSSATQWAYEWSINHLIEVNGIANKSPKDLNVYHFEEVIFKQDLSTSSRHFYFRHYRTWWNWMLKNELVKRDFFDELKENLPRKRENTRPKMISEKELKLLFNTYDEELERKRKLPEFDPNLIQLWFKPLMAVYFYAGLRKHEAAYDPGLPYSGLKGENLIYEKSELAYIYLPPTKGRKERQVPISKELGSYLEEYLKIRGEIGPEEYLFVYTGGHQKGKPVRGERAYKEFKRYLKEAGIPSKRTIHGMRHQAVTSWIEKGFHTAEAGYMAGHSSQRVTEKYTHLTAKRLKEKMDRM